MTPKHEKLLNSLINQHGIIEVLTKIGEQAFQQSENQHSPHETQRQYLEIYQSLTEICYDHVNIDTQTVFKD